MNYYYCRPVILVFALLLSAYAFGQKPNTYKFIEPNISVSYDSSLFKIAQRYSNTFYETESYDFVYQPDTAYNVKMHIAADHSRAALSQRTVDSILLAALKNRQSKKMGSLSLVSVDTTVRHIKGFSFTGFVVFDKKGEKYGTLISGFHLTENDKTEIRYSSENRNDLEKEYAILQLLLQDFRSYSKKQVEQEDSLIKGGYTVRVKATKEAPESFSFRRKTYTGIVSVEQPLKHKMEAVWLNTSIGQEAFFPDSNGIVAIACYDEQKGLVEKEGELVLLNSFGKKVKVPFTFSYENKGVQ